MDSYYKITKVNENVYRIFEPAGVFMDLFVGTEKALLLDTGYGFGNLKAVVRSITDLPLIIVNTHGHVDHSCGNWQFEESVYLHEQDMDLCKLHNGRQQRAIAVECTRENSTDEQKLLPEDFDEEFYLLQGIGNIVRFKGEVTFSLGGITLRGFEFPGHTKGSIGLLYEEEGILYAGDAMNPAVWLFLPESRSLPVYIESLKKAINLDFSKLVVSHIPELLDKSVLYDYLDLAENLDFEGGADFTAPLVPGATAKVCCRKGYTQDDMGKPGFASIVIDKKHLG